LPVTRAYTCPPSVYADPASQANTARFVFFSPAARRLYADWECVAEAGVGALRVEAGRYFYDRELSNLIGELSTRSCWRAGPPRPRWRRQPRRTPGTSVPPQPVLWLPPSAGPRRGFDICGCHWGFLPLPLTAETPTSLSCRCAAPT
jgi:hypothetical protein